jgi:hypothetical protein
MGLFCFWRLNPVISPARSPLHCQTSRQPPITASKSHFTNLNFADVEKRLPRVVRAYKAISLHGGRLVISLLDQISVKLDLLSKPMTSFLLALSVHD